MRKSRIITLLTLAMLVVFSMSLCLAGCRPGYREVWTPVEVPNDIAWVDNDDINIIKSRINDEILDADLDIDPLMAKVRPDGTFEGYDYYIKERTEQWAPLEHLRALKNMQIAYSSPGNKYYKDEAVKTAVVRGIEFWVDNNFYCDWSGWNNTIGLGLCVPDLLLLDDGAIEEKDKEALLARIKSTLLQNGKLRFPVKERTVNEGGGNLTDQVIATLKVACLENDGKIVMWLTSLLENELRPFPPYKGRNYHRWDAEGPKEDYSFQQHDQLIYYGGYGEVFLSGMNRYLGYTIGTQYEISDKALNFYAHFVIDGIQFAYRNTYRDISASGRGIARQNGLHGIYTQVKLAVNMLLRYHDETDVKFEDEVISGLNKVYNDRILPMDNGETDMGAGGHRYFYESDYNAYNGDKYMATVRHASNRTRMFEYLNFENRLGYYTGAGATFYYVDGDEYYNLMPAYDWNRVPGTTTRQGVMPTMNQDFSYNTYGDNKYAMGVSNGKVGMSYFREDVKAVNSRKAYFMFEDGVVCLGTDIRCGLPNKVITNINQAHLDGEVLVSQNGDIKTYKDDANIKGVFDYIYHDKIGYIVDGEAELSLEKGRTGNWQRVYTKGQDTPVSEDFFTLDINHGLWPMGKGYDYTVLMNTTPDATRAYSASPYLKTIANTKAVQAVYDAKNDVLEAVFHKAGSITLDDGRTISVNGGACIIVEKVSGKNIVTIASSDYAEHSVDVAVGGKTKGVTIGKRPISLEF